MQAGHSALAYFEDGEMRHHKVIKKYMVRGNGKAQVGYLQTRGKSKAGSRIRLANTVSFLKTSMKNSLNGTLPMKPHEFW
jgi:hypothetical protein